jgi:hypothetical protein
MAKRIDISPNIPLNEWIDNNRNFVMDTVYDNIFDFLESDEDRRIVLEIIMKQRMVIDSSDYDGVSMDFVITKNSIDETLDRMIKHYENTEEYEKCAKLVKLK